MSSATARLRFFLALSLLAGCVLAQSTKAGTASYGNRNFPAKKKFGDQTTSDWTTYGTELLIQSGGVGIGVGIVLMAVLFIHFCCWGMFCNFCRCCCFKRRVTRDAACFQRPSRKWSVILAVVCLAISVAGVIVIFVNTSSTWSKIDVMFQHTTDSIVDGENFLCGGTVAEAMRNGVSADAVIAGYGSLDATMAACPSGSLGAFVSSVIVQTNSTFGSITSFIDTTQSIIPALNESITAAANLSLVATAINTTVVDFATGATTDKANLEAIYGTGLKGGYIPDANEIPQADSTVLATPTVVQQQVEVAKENLISTRNSVMPSLDDDLNVKARSSVTENQLSVLNSVRKLANQMIDFTETLTKREDDTDKPRKDVADTEDTGKYVMAAIYAVTTLFLIFQLAGYMCKRTCCMCCGAYLTFFFFIYLALILGIFLVLSMIVYDMCGCEGEYTVDGCATMFTVLSVNLGNSSYSFGDAKVYPQTALKSLLNCPAERDASGGYIYADNTNFVDIFGIEGSFNYSKYTSGPIADLFSGQSQLNQTATLNEAINLTAYSAIYMSRVEVATGYDYTNDTTLYNNLNTNLQGGSYASYYTSTPSSSDNTANQGRLTSLANNAPVQAGLRDQLILQTANYNQSAGNLTTAINGIQTALDNSISSIDTSVTSLNDLVNLVTTINQYTPCDVVSNAYKNIIITDLCESVFTTLDGVVPGAILCLVASFVGTFLLVMMRDCVVFYHEEETGVIADMDIQAEAEAPGGPQYGPGDQVGSPKRGPDEIVVATAL